MENAIHLHLPVTVTYAALQAALQQKIVGEFIPDPEKEGEAAAYGKIQAVAVGASQVAGYQVVLALKISILRTLLKRDHVDLLVYAALAYDNARQLVYIKKYKVDVRTSSSFYNAALEVLANSVAYDKVMKKARFDVGERLGQEVEKVNTMLAAGLEVKGVRLQGAVAEVQVQDLAADESGLSLSVQIRADVQVAVLDLSSLMAARSE